MQEGPIRLVPRIGTVFDVVGTTAYKSTSWPFWTRWGWCKIDDILKLINREYNRKWKKRDLLTRFAYEAKDLRGKGSNMKRPPFAVLMSGKHGQFTFTEYSPGLLPQLEKANEDFCVPSGWVKDVLWALYNGALRFEVQTDPDQSGSKSLVAIVCEQPMQGYTV